VLQEIFLRLQRGLPDLRAHERFGPWVYRIARSAIADHYRALARNPLAAGASPDAAALAPESGGDVECELVAYIASFVAALPSPYRDAITLTELEGLTHKQAAEMLGVSLSGMKSRVQRGRQRLRKSLEACCKVALDARGGVICCERRADAVIPEGCCE
jgi:RNA polymerase sigma-70 factor (ECF subfamily)